MVAGHLQEKKGYYYIVLNYTDEGGNRKNKWQSTGLPVKGNKKRAEKLLLEARAAFQPEEEIRASKRKEKKKEEAKDNILFADFLLEWLEVVRYKVDEVTYLSYRQSVEKRIVPYFRKKKIRLTELTARDIQTFYTEQLKTVKATTVIHYHANIHSALKYAFKQDYISTNPADKIERPRKEKYVGKFYSQEEIEQLLEAVRGTKLELPVWFGSFYGLRRSEVVGLKWEAVDFERNIFTIRHTVVSVYKEGGRVELAKDTTKTKSSMRTLPLVKKFREKLLEVQKRQKENQRLCGRSYNRKYLEYIMVDDMGNLITPSYITSRFPVLLEQKGLRRIRFHDLRHSCASLLLANDVPMKQIQEWLGHSDFSTTANIYAHLDFSSKLSSADAMQQAFHFGEQEEDAEEP